MDLTPSCPLSRPSLPFPFSPLPLLLLGDGQPHREAHAGDHPPTHGPEPGPGEWMWVDTLEPHI